MSARLLCLSFLVTLGAGCSDSHTVGDADGGVFFLDVRAVDAPPVADAGHEDDASVRGDASLSGACDVPSECTLRAASCCGSCGAATPDDMIALADGEVAGYEAAVCGDDIGCPECAQDTDPYLLATCRASECIAVNLHVDPLTECETDTDCVLASAQCCSCETLSLSQIVAYNPARGSLGSLLCDPDADCPPCVPDFGGNFPYCDLGRCAVGAPD